ncbi:MAG: UDP-N-acetylglucosamine--N-acetylmuramyl-(pentapeptide) pyrophosphoryl-undecaprenol N-acetylglucosamine transferase, partial [Spirochaetales bacterium]|nr:UDP-N-acetylglucosamine--N-acetylmuramyl-(pentapeptide) pyrophosphoryl-undecaprenol N-acetylglucosamine transferase [Spirochaetales bacterium]
MQVIAFTGGGTGGHVYPGLAVLDYLKKNFPYRFVWIGSSDGMEKKIVENHGVEYFGVPSGKLRRYLSWRNITDLFQVYRGYRASLKLLRKIKPILVFSKGGFVSVPPVFAARRLQIPVVSHESDFDPGLATRLNAKASQFICVPYNESRSFFHPRYQDRLVVTGNPVRDELLTGNKDWIRQTWNVPPKVPILLVLGGSLGAVQLNDLVKEHLESWKGRLFVVHQTGTSWSGPPSSLWYVARPYFTTEMADLYASADLVLARAGAGTLWEAAAAQAPLFLVPLESGSRGDQIRNADLFKKAGAAEVWRPSEGLEC